MRRAILPNLRLLTTAVLLAGMCSLSQAETQRKSIPQFREYPTKSPLIWMPTQPDLSNPEAYNYRTRIRKASQERANFAGHHVLTTWGCGSQCATGAILNLPTGKVTFLPTICCWKGVDEDFRPFEFRENSRLLILSGKLNEQGDDASHFFDFDDGRLTKVTSIARVVPQSVSSPVQAPTTFDDLPDSIWDERPRVGYTSKSSGQTQQEEQRDPTFMDAFGNVAKARADATESSNGWPAEYTSIIKGIENEGVFGSFRNTQLALTFLARGGVIFPIQSTPTRSTFVVYNPSVDVGFVISFSAGAPSTPSAATLVPGEILRSERIDGPTPKWMKSAGTLVEEIRSTSETVRKSNATSYFKATSTLDPIADFTATMKGNAKFRTVARDRLFSSAVFASNSGMRCGEFIDQKTGTVDQMRSAVSPQPLPISVDPGLDTSTYAVGGAVNDTHGVKLYALKTNPYVMFAVWFSGTNEECRLERIVPISVLSQSKD